MTRTAVEMLQEMSEAFVDYRDNSERKIKSMTEEIDHISAHIAQANRAGLGGPIADKSDRDSASEFFSIVRKRPVQADMAMVEDYQEYRAGLFDYVRRGKDAVGSEVWNKLSVGSDPDGGYFVMPDLARDIIRAQTDISPIRQIARVRRIGSDALEGIYRQTRAAAKWVGEGEGPGETPSPKFGKYRIAANELAAEPIVTLKELEDALLDVGELLREELAEAFEEEEGAKFVSGDGVDKPRGFLDYSGDAVTTDDKTRDWGVLQYIPTGAAAGFPTQSGGIADDPDGLLNTVAALKPRYRANATWVMNRATASVVRKLKDGDGRYLWRDGLEEGQPNRLLGYRVVEAEDMPDIASDAFSIAFGDFRAGYTIVDRIMMSILRDPFTSKGNVKFYTRKRVGGDVVNFEAIKLVKIAAS